MADLVTLLKRAHVPVPPEIAAKYDPPAKPLRKSRGRAAVATFDPADREQITELRKDLAQAQGRLAAAQRQLKLMEQLHIHVDASTVINEDASPLDQLIQAADS